jgi:TatD DNase family protein
MIMPKFYDTHAHLHYPDYEPDLPQAIARAQAAGIAKIVAVGIDLASSERAVRLAEQFDCLYATVGWHPTHAHEAPPDLRPELRALAKHPKVVAIGEAGLDYYRHPQSKPEELPVDVDAYKRNQARIFEQQLEVAAETGLNIVVHQRESFADALALVRKFAGRVRGQFHCFDGDAAVLEQVLAIGSVVSFTGILTFKKRQDLRDVFAAAPLGRFMLETDSPYLVPEPHRGRVRRCEPAFVKDIAEVAARVKGCTLEELSAATCATAHEFFPRMR